MERRPKAAHQREERMSVAGEIDGTTVKADEFMGDRRSSGNAPRSGIPAWLPDLITSSRIALAPVFVIAAEATVDAAAAGESTLGPRALTILLLLGIAGSDRLDGYLARKSERGPTKRGAVLDAVADRLIQWTGALYFALRPTIAFTALPFWFPLALLARECLLILAWLHPYRGPASYEHEMHGKVATVMVFSLLLLAAAHVPAPLVVSAATLSIAAVLYSASRYALRMSAARES
jgi:phosphatidylglycerophosphate synthase